MLGSCWNINVGKYSWCAATICLNSLKGLGLDCFFGFRKIHVVDQSNISIQFS